MKLGFVMRLSSFLFLLLTTRAVSSVQAGVWTDCGLCTVLDGGAAACAVQHIGVLCFGDDGGNWCYDNYTTVQCL